MTYPAVHIILTADDSNSAIVFCICIYQGYRYRVYILYRYYYIDIDSR